jgi:hypothetical protein
MTLQFLHIRSLNLNVRSLPLESQHGVQNANVSLVMRLWKLNSTTSDFPRQRSSNSHAHIAAAATVVAAVSPGSSQTP